MDVWIDVKNVLLLNDPQTIHRSTVPASSVWSVVMLHSVSNVQVQNYMCVAWG